MRLRAITRRWGNSIAVILPHDIVQKNNISADDEVTISVEKTRPKAGVMFGTFPQLGKGQSTQELKDEMRAGWLSDSDRERERQWRKRK